jgi:hypothetical protein
LDRRHSKKHCNRRSEEEVLNPFVPTDGPIAPDGPTRSLDLNEVDIKKFEKVLTASVIGIRLVS